MVMTMRVTHDFARFRETLTNYEAVEFPYAAALALTRAAQTAKKAEQSEMRRLFDRPKPWTINGVYVEPATKQRLEANVHFKDFAPKGVPAGRYLRPQIEGGPRAPKASEKRLRAAGVLPGDRFLIPGDGAELDAFGNVRQGQIVKILSAFNALAGPGSNGNANGRRGRGKRRAESYFAMQPGNQSGMAPGIYRRTQQGGHLLVFVFGKQPTYRERFDFYKIAMHSYERSMPGLIVGAMEHALRTARR